tara:strand:- start:25121 stop:25729 length:609 start_codon:yes stop_codon:yes gene_type:complete
MKYILKIVLILIIICYVSLNVSAQNIILESSNNFTDIIEPDVTIYKNGESSPVLGKNIEFSCGKCDSANFEETVSKIGGKGKLCGYKGGVPINIVLNDDQLCARSTISNQKYDLDLLTWVAHGRCTDDNNGSSCSIAKNQFSYTRSGEVILKQLDSEIDSKTNLSIVKETSWLDKNFDIIILVVLILGVIFLIVLSLLKILK